MVYYANLSAEQAKNINKGFLMVLAAYALHAYVHHARIDVWWNNHMIKHPHEKHINVTRDGQIHPPC